MAGFIHGEKLKYYSRALTSDGTLNVLFVSTSQSYLELLGKDLYMAREVQRDKRTYSLKVHTCKNVLDVLQYMPQDFYVDFIIFLLDAKLGHCLKEVEHNLLYLDSNFPREKICLVNPEASFVRTKITPLEIWEFARQHQFNLINQQIKEKNNIFNLSKRILNLVESCCGIVNGIPMVNVV